MPVFRQHLLLGGTTLEDCRLLSDCNIVTHSTIDMKFRHYLVSSSSEMLDEEKELEPRAVDLAYSVVVGNNQVWKANYSRKYQQWPMINGTIVAHTLGSIIIQCETDIIVEKMGRSENLILQLYKVKPLTASHFEEELIDGTLFIDKYNYLIKFTPSSTLTTSSSQLPNDGERCREIYKLVMNVAGYDASSLVFETPGNVNDVNKDFDVSRILTPGSCSAGRQLNDHVKATDNNVNDDQISTANDAEEAEIDMLCGKVKTQTLSGDSTTSGEEFGEDDDEDKDNDNDEKSDDNVNGKPVQRGKRSSHDGLRQGVAHGRRVQTRRNRSNEESITVGSLSIPLPPAVISANSSSVHAADATAPRPSSPKSYLRMAAEHLFKPGSHKNPIDMIILLDELGISGADIEQAEAMLVCMDDEDDKESLKQLAACLKPAPQALFKRAFF